jgi:hypothetical protein
MNNQTNIYFTTVDAHNVCIEKEITEFIISDNNIAVDICNSVDKYKFLINNLSIDSKIVSFMIKIIMNNKIIYNQLFNLKNKDNIVTSTSNTVFTYDETLNKFTKLWIYIPKTIFDILDIFEPIIEQTVEVRLIPEQPVEVKQIVEQSEVKSIVEQSEVKQIEVKLINEQSIETKPFNEVEIHQSNEVEINQINDVVIHLINEVETKQFNEVETTKLNEIETTKINEVETDEYKDMPPLINFDEIKVIATN